MHRWASFPRIGWTRDIVSVFCSILPFQPTNTFRKFFFAKYLTPYLKSFHLIFFRTLNNNNITTLPRETFSGMPRIRALRLSDNPFTCDCHLSWLSRYLRNSPRLAPYTKCHSPSQLKGQSVAELHEHDFKCSGLLKKSKKKTKIKLKLFYLGLCKSRPINIKLNWWGTERNKRATTTKKSKT